jgi:hypothetical protein
LVVDVISPTWYSWSLFILSKRRKSTFRAILISFWISLGFVYVVFVKVKNI